MGWRGEVRAAGGGWAWGGGPEGRRERARPSDSTLKKVLQREATFCPSHLAWESDSLGSGPGYHFLMILSEFLE